MSVALMLGAPGDFAYDTPGLDRTRPVHRIRGVLATSQARHLRILGDFSPRV